MQAESIRQRISIPSFKLQHVVAACALPAPGVLYGGTWDWDASRSEANQGCASSFSQPADTKLGPGRPQPPASSHLPRPRTRRRVQATAFQAPIPTTGGAPMPGPPRGAHEPQALNSLAPEPLSRTQQPHMVLVPPPDPTPDGGPLPELPPPTPAPHRSPRSAMLKWALLSTSTMTASASQRAQPQHLTCSQVASTMGYLAKSVATEAARLSMEAPGAQELGDGWGTMTHAGLGLIPRSTLRTAGSAPVGSESWWAEVEEAVVELLSMANLPQGLPLETTSPDAAHLMWACGSLSADLQRHTETLRFQIQLGGSHTQGSGHSRAEIEADMGSTGLRKRPWQQSGRGRGTAQVLTLLSGTTQQLGTWMEPNLNLCSPTHLCKVLSGLAHTGVKPSARWLQAYARASAALLQPPPDPLPSWLPPPSRLPPSHSPPPPTPNPFSTSSKSSNSVNSAPCTPAAPAPAHPSHPSLPRLPYSAHQLAVTAWALGTLRVHLPAPWLEVFIPACMRQLQAGGFTQQGLTNLIWGCARLRVRPVGSFMKLW